MGVTVVNTRFRGNTANEGGGLENGKEGTTLN